MPGTATRSSGVALRRLMPLAFLAMAGISFVVLGGHRYLTFAALAENRAWLCGLVARWGAGAVLVYVLIYAALVALSVPGFAWRHRSPV